MDINFVHYSVMLDECVNALNINPDGIYVDCTLGGGGHSLEIAKKLHNGKLIAIDQDISAIEASKKRLTDYMNNIIFVHNNFSNINSILETLSINKIDGALIDLGVSSYQLDTPERGFSYNNDAILDMRMNRDNTLSAYDVVNTYSEEHLKKIIFEYGEERFAQRIAYFIVKSREISPIYRTGNLVDIIRSAIPAKAREDGPHPAKRTFQAIRIEVNKELDVIVPTLKSIVGYLNQNGRLAVMTFHSLEDRLTKQTFASLSKGCTCPSDFPMCVCGKKPLIEIITKKPVLPSDIELEKNPRSRSAKLRIISKK